uniref:alkaline phosphatase n=1 Tax=Graphocephala atropunctata TaxID=36148 RepID=A0A1B6M053_9HEMI
MRNFLSISLLLTIIYHTRAEIYGSIDPHENEASYWLEQGQQQLDDKLKVKANQKKAKNVIIFVGDGMSVTTTTAARIYLGQNRFKNSGEGTKLKFEEFPYVGLAKTYCVDKQVGEAACTSTAYLSGVKANSGTVGVSAAVARGDCSGSQNPEYQVETILDWAQEAGKATGIITGDRVTGPSAAGNYAHSADKQWEHDFDVLTRCNNLDPTECKDIARQLVEDKPGRNIKVILGGGRYKMLPKSPTSEEGKGDRRDGRNLVKEWLQDKSSRGTAKYVTTRSELLAVETKSTDYLLGLFNSLGMTYHTDKSAARPSLAECLTAALRILKKEKEGFYLFVENGRIEKAHLANQAQRAFDEVLELNRALWVAESMVDMEETLIVVLGDHSHSLTMSGYPDRGADILGIGGYSELDGLPYSILSYASGPGAQVSWSGGRRDVSGDDFHNVSYRFPALVPHESETLSGEDVPVYASGPWARLLSGTYEQSYIPLAIAYAAQIGPSKPVVEEKEETDEQPWWFGYPNNFS